MQTDGQWGDNLEKLQTPSNSILVESLAILVHSRASQSHGFGVVHIHIPYVGGAVQSKHRWLIVISSTMSRRRIVARRSLVMSTTTAVTAITTRAT